MAASNQTSLTQVSPAGTSPTVFTDEEGNPTVIVQNVMPSTMDINVRQTAQQLQLEGLKMRVANALLNWYNDGNLALVREAFASMFPGIGGTVTDVNGAIQSTSFLGEGCIAYSGLTRLGSDVFGTTMTPNKMQDQLDNAWLPTRLDTDPLQLTYPIMGPVVINGELITDYNPEDWDHSVNLGATLMDDQAKILGDQAADALPILGYRLFVKAIDNHVGDTRIVLTAYDTSRATSETYKQSPVIYKTTLHMGVTAVSNFTGMITVLPLRRTGLVNLNGSFNKNTLQQMMFSGYSSERLQDYEVMCNVARETVDGYISDFTLRIDAGNALVYVLPIYPMLSDYSALMQLIQSGSVRAYASYLHLLSNNTI